MKVERVRPATYQLTMHAHELAALLAAARAVAEGSAHEISAESVQHLREVIAGYDDGVRALERVGPDPSTLN